VSGVDDRIKQLEALLAEVIDDVEHLVIDGWRGYIDRDMIVDYRERAKLPEGD
jgi:hypothetical protein